MNAYEQHKVRTFVWTLDASTGNAPTTEYVVDLRQVCDFDIQVDSTAAGNLSTDIDITMLRCLNYDEATPVWDTLTTDLVVAHPDAKIKTYHISTVAGGWMKLRLDNNSVGAATVTAILKKRARRS